MGLDTEVTLTFFNNSGIVRTEISSANCDYFEFLPGEVGLRVCMDDCSCPKKRRIDEDGVDASKDSTDGDVYRVEIVAIPDNTEDSGNEKSDDAEVEIVEYADPDDDEDVVEESDDGEETEDAYSNYDSDPEDNEDDDDDDCQEDDGDEKADNVSTTHEDL